jgi:NAD(P)-dependent dehydrogenase (short-subunit alcohol dehydrogenase family)
MKFTIPDTIPRAALITGGAHQAAITQILRQAGFAVAVQCTDDPDDPPEGTISLQADLSDEAQTAALIGRAIAALGPIGVLINGTGAFARDAWDDVTRATWDMHIETNLRAPFVLIQQFARALPPAAEGVAINLLNQRICPRMVSYTLSKAALWTLTQTMALALATNIRVNAIDPGPVDPGMIDIGAIETGDIGSGADAGAGPHEVARAVLAILALRSMTGQMMAPGGFAPPSA